MAIFAKPYPCCVKRWNFTHRTKTLVGVYDYLALRAAKSGRHGDAARLAGYADALWEGSPRQVNERRAFRELQEMLRKALGDDETVRLARLGTWMTEEQARALALQADE